MALDLGGSTLRVALLRLGTVIKVISNSTFSIPDCKKHINLEFFDWIAFQVSSTIPDKYRGECLATGVTWSFPLVQTAANDGVINECGKGFLLDQSLENVSLKKLFEDACRPRGLQMVIYAIINDTVAVYVTSKFHHDSTELALVLGTGTNLCASVSGGTVEIDKGKKAICHFDDREASYMVNVEACFFGEFLRTYLTKHDIAIHSGWNDVEDSLMQNDSTNLFQPFEFLTSGRYFSELVRLAVMELVDLKVLFDNRIVDKKMYSQFEYFSGATCIDLYNGARSYELVFGVTAFSWEIDTVAAIIEAVVERGAILVASFIVALQRFKNSKASKIIKIGYDGSILKHFEYYRAKVDQWLKTIDSENQYQLVCVEESSIHGAAIAASVNVLRQLNGVCNA